MLYRDLEEFFNSIPKNRRIMCVDMGEKRTGIAFSDRTQFIATAYGIYQRRNTSKDLGYFNRVLHENEAESLVIGLPLEVDEQTKRWRARVVRFAQKMVKKYGVNTYLQDERLSTFIALDILKTAGVSVTKSKRIDDKVAASIILQRTLDAMNLFNRQLINKAKESAKDCMV